MRRHPFALPLTLLASLAATTLAAPPILARADGAPSDWPLWEQYRTTVAHPATAVKAADVARARQNVARYGWARQYRDDVEAKCAEWLPKLTPDFLIEMIPATTPGAIGYTPCPACRDEKKPPNTHGLWSWSPKDPDHLTCTVCGTVYPNDRYPESIVLKAHYGGQEQDFSFYGGPTFVIFSDKTGRPSFTGNIRGQKVEWSASLCRNFAEAYALTGKPEYADAARRILLRFAEVYPHYLVHSGYGDYVDIDPHIAARDVNHLPVDKLAAPPTRPNRALITGYWSAGRATSTGMEASFVRRVVDAYDLTCMATKPDGSPVYSSEEKRRIEKDLLLESTYLLTADPSVNNKSVGNAASVGLVGMTVGEPTLVRFGLKTWEQTVDHWFLPDGATPESWSYALQTLNGIQEISDALKGYSDPPGYRDADGKHLADFNPYATPEYKRVWSAMFDGLQGDLHYPPLADSHRKDGMSAHYAELMAANYPDVPQYDALLRAVAGPHLSDTDAAIAVYRRATGLEAKPAPPLVLPDHLFPVLQIGYLRAGAAGRDSTLILSASDWGVHHHQDSLNLVWWQNGHELLSDLGYLWDHPQKIMTERTLAHNTVMIDGQEQAEKGRGGKFTRFAVAKTGGVKVMEAESRAYPNAALYRRTVAQIAAGNGSRYVVDIFRVRGGGSRFDYVFHGPNTNLASDAAAPTLAAFAPKDAPPTGKPLDLKNLRRIGADANGQARVSWTLAGGTELTALWPAEPAETDLLADGWGQRDYKNTDAGALLPYIVRRRIADGPDSAAAAVFTGIFEEHPAAAPFVQSLRRLPTTGDTVALRVETAAGVDYVVSTLGTDAATPITVATDDGLLTVAAPFAVVRFAGGKPVYAFATDAAQGGAAIRWRGAVVKAELGATR